MILIQINTRHVRHAKLINRKNWVPEPKCDRLLEGKVTRVSEYFFGHRWRWEELPVDWMMDGEAPGTFEYLKCERMLAYLCL